MHCSPNGDPLIPNHHHHYVATPFTSETLKDFLLKRAAACQARLTAVLIDGGKDVDAEVAAVADLLAEVDATDRPDAQKEVIRKEIRETYSESAIRTEHARNREARLRPLREAVEDFNTLAENVAPHSVFVLSAADVLGLFTAERELPALREFNRRTSASTLLRDLRRSKVPDLKRTADALFEAADDLRSVAKTSARSFG